jgi:hypothetical protein
MAWKRQIWKLEVGSAEERVREEKDNAETQRSAEKKDRDSP